MTEYIYLLQEREFITTNQNVYKLGKTKQENLQRFKQYPKGSKLIIQLESKNCDINEKKLIIIFKQKFIQRIDIGTEYFEGNPDVMRKIICDYINNEEEDQEDQDQEDQDQEDQDQEDHEYQDEEDQDEEEYLDPTIPIMFPNYKDDESFGGKQKLIKVIIEKKEIQYEYNLLIYYIDSDKCVNYERRVISNKCESWYYEKLIQKKVIENNTIYNLNDKKFIKLLNNYKKNIKIHSEYNSYFKEQYYIYKAENYNSIIDVVFENCIFNDEIYCDCCFPKSCGCSYIAINTKFSIEEYGKYNTAAYSNNNRIAIIDIDNTLYDYALLRKYTPYLITYTNNEYTIKNRNYEIIGLEEKIEVIENNTSNTIESSTVNTGGSGYLYKDGSNPFRPSHKKTRMVALLNDMKSNYIRITKNKTCTHKISEYTKLILNL